MELPLQLRYDSGGKHRPAGLLIRVDAANWMTALSRSGILSSDVTLLFFELQGVPHALVAGLESFATRDELMRPLVAQSAITEAMPPAVIYRRLADRLYLPLESELFPKVSESELRAMLPADSESRLLWHPSAGLIQFEAEQGIKVFQLLRTPTESSTSWDAARRGETLNDRIHSLSADTAESLHQIFEQGPDGIGSDSANLSQAPPAPDEVRLPLLQDALRNLKQVLAKAVFAVTSKLPDRPGGSKSLAKLHQWAAAIISGLMASGDGAKRGTGLHQSPVPQQLSARRENELKRLLNLLENDPDQGLRYALPLNGNSGRGIATPSSRLGERSPEFSTRNLNPSGPADGWDLPWDYRQRLTQRYRDLAQREVRLGNHRRAAYIYATLLGDLNAAAVTLEKGGLFRDAATVFEKHLNNPLRAAECLQAGGYWEDALVIYRDRGKWIEAGELLLKLDQPEEARVMFGNEIRRRTACSDFAMAGQLAETRLQDPDQAATLLLKGWEANASAETCFRNLLDLYSRHGQHVRARSIVLRLTDSSSVLVHQRPAALKVCSDIATNYPDVAVREVARQQTWQLASSVLSDRFSEHHSLALASLPMVAVTDELLKRDVGRFSETLRDQKQQRSTGRKSSPPRTAVRSAPNKVGKELELRGRTQLVPVNAPQGTRWIAAIGGRESGFAIAVTPAEELLAVNVPESSVDSRILSGQAARLLPFEVYSLSRCQLRSSSVPGKAFVQMFPATASWNRNALEQLAGTCDFLNVLPPQCELLLDFLQLPTGTVWALFFDDGRGFVVEAIGMDGLVRQTIELNLNDSHREFRDEATFRIHHDGTRLIVQTGRFVWQVDSEFVDLVDKSSHRSVTPESVVEFPSMPLQMTASPSATTLRLVFGFRAGVYAVWPMTSETCAFASDFECPLLACTANGSVVVCCPVSGRIACYRLNAGHAENIGEYRVKFSGTVISLFAGPRGNEFHALFDTGLIITMRIPF